MRKDFVSLILICSLALTACTNSSGDVSVLTETTYAASEEITRIEASETAKESEYAQPEFTGVEISDEAIENFSFEKSSTYGFRIFCYSDDMVYFSDINENWRLYSYDGEKASLILDKQAHYIYYYDNCIYFLSDKFVDALNYSHSGILYKYDIESGNVTKLTDENVYVPKADETGIYYSKNIDDRYYMYRLDEESGEEELLYEGYEYYRIGDYEISRVQTGKIGQNEVYDYYLVKGDEKIGFVSGTAVWYDLIHNGVFYYRDWNSELYSVDLRTGERNILPYAFTFTFLGDELYYCANDSIDCLSIYHWNDEEPELMYLIGCNLPVNGAYRGDWDDPLGYGFYGLNRIYSDNKALYAYVYPSNDVHEFHLAKVGPLDDGSGDYIIDPIH